MISILLDHYTIKTARRALLIAAFSAILLPSLTISGDGLEFFGLTLKLEQASILTAMRLISFYFLWIFAWLNIATVTDAMPSKIEAYFEKRIQNEQDAASALDCMPNEENYSDQYSEPWWLHYGKVREKLLKRQGLIGICVKQIGWLAVVSIEYAPPLVLAILAILAPEATNNFLFSLLK